VADQEPSAQPPKPEAAAILHRRSAEDIALLGCLVLVLIVILPLFLILMGGSIASIPLILVFVVAVYFLLKLSFKLFGVEKMVQRERAKSASSLPAPPTARPPADSTEA
jgi:fatty acid desaturase